MNMRQRDVLELTRDMSGLELMRRWARGEFPGPPIASVIPMRIESAEKGRVEFSAKAGGEHLNPLGVVHGGFAATVLDSVTGCAVHTMLESGVAYATTDLNVKMLKAVPKERWLTAEGKIIHISRQLGVSEGTLKDDDGNVYAHATATCMIRR